MKPLKSAILTSSLLLSINTGEARTWPQAIDHALYQHIAVDTARVQLRIESDPFLEVPDSSGVHNDGITSPPTLSPTSAPCREGSIHYQMNMHDSSGNGWQGTTIQVIGIKDQDTLETPDLSTSDSLTYTTTTKLNTNEGNGYVALSNTIQFGSGALLSNSQQDYNFPLGKVFESALTRGSSDHADICLVPRRCYDIVVNRGTTLEEVTWNLTAIGEDSDAEEDAYIQGSAPMYCKFSIPDANGEVFCPTECSEEIPEKYVQGDASFVDLFHPPVETGEDGGFSALYNQFAGKNELPGKGEPAPKGKYSMFLAIGDQGEDEVATKPLEDRPPVFDIDSIGLPALPAEEDGEDGEDNTIEGEGQGAPINTENQDAPATEEGTTETENEETPIIDVGHDTTTEIVHEATPVDTEIQETPAEGDIQEIPVEEEGQGITTEDTPLEQDATVVDEGQETPAVEGDPVISPLSEDAGTPVDIEPEVENPPAVEGDSGSFGESGAFVSLSGGTAVVQSAQIVSVPSNVADDDGDDDDGDDDDDDDDDDSLASQGMTEADSSLPLTSEVRSAGDIELLKDKTLAIPEYSGTMQFEEKEPEVDVSEALPVDPTEALPVTRASAPVKTDTFHMLLRHGGKR